MKVAINYNQDKDIVQEADEIIMPWDKVDKKLFEYVELYPDKDIIIDLPKSRTLDWPSIKACAQHMRDNNHELYIRLHDITPYLELKKCIDNNLKYFYSEPVKTFFELKELKKMGVSFVYVDAPLFFQMDEVKKFGIPLRIVPNRAYVQGGVPHATGLYGTWIRPEKLDLYENYAYACEFMNFGVKQERAFYNIYIRDKAWPGDMNDIIYGFNFDMDNRLVYEGLDEARLNCKQTCQNFMPGCLMCKKVAHFEKTGRMWAKQQLEERGITEESPMSLTEDLPHEDKPEL